MPNESEPGDIESELAEIEGDLEDFSNKSDPTQESVTDKQDISLSKEEIEDKFDGLFVASQKSPQHLTRDHTEETLCGVDLTEKDWATSREPGPFSPICTDCQSIIATSSTEHLNTRMEMREWLEDNVDGVEPAKGRVTNLRANEMRAIIEHIKTLESKN